MVSIQIQVLLKEFQIHPGILETVSDFLSFVISPTLICFVGAVWSLEQMETKHDSQWAHGRRPAPHMVPISSQSLLAFLLTHYLPANPALGINMRIPGNEGFHLVRPKGELFLPQTRFLMVLHEFHSSGGSRSASVQSQPLYHSRNTNISLAPGLPSVFSEFSSLAGLRSLVTSNLQLADDQM